MLIDKRSIKTQLDRYLIELREQALSQSTMQCYSSRVSLFVEYLLANASDPLDIESEIKLYCQVLLAEQYASSSINASLTAIEDFVPKLTLRPVKFARLEFSRSKIQLLSDEQQHLFLSSIDSCQSTRDRFLLLLLFHAGMSIRCLIDLNVQNLLLTAHNGEIDYFQARQSAESFAVKNIVQLNDQTRQSALQWLIERAELASAAGTDALFLNEKGQRMSSAGAGYLVKRFGWRIKMELSGRILRNTCLSKHASVTGVTDSNSASADQDYLAVGSTFDASPDFVPLTPQTQISV